MGSVTEIGTAASARPRRLLPGQPLLDQLVGHAGVDLGSVAFMKRAHRLADLLVGKGLAREEFV
jgi:hypothetical protein